SAALAGYSQTPNDRSQSCLASEQRTREELTKHWSSYPAEDRIGCVKSLTFSPTYTQLVTCLEMRRDVRALRDRKPTLRPVLGEDPTLGPGVMQSPPTPTHAR